MVIGNHAKNTSGLRIKNITGNFSDTKSGLPFASVKIAVKALNKRGVVTDFE
jgi:hypothetical protein